MPETLIPPNIGMLDAILFTNVLLFYIRFASVDFKRLAIVVGVLMLCYLQKQTTSELSESQGKSLRKPEEKYVIEGGQFKARKKEVLDDVLKSIKNDLCATYFGTEKGRQIALSVAQEISKSCDEEVSKAGSINNLLIETVQKYLSNLKQFGMNYEHFRYF